MLYISTEEHPEIHQSLIPVCVLLIAFGVEASIMALYVAHTEMFPAVFRTTTVAFCQVVGRFCAIFSP